MKKNVKIAIEAVLLIACIGLVFAIYKSIMQPVEFNRQKEYRESVAIQRLKDIRTLQVAFKSVYGRFSPTADSLVNFYNNGKMEIQMQVGSKDDSLAWANTEKLRKQGLKDADLLQRYLAGEKNLVFAIKQPIAVKDTLFRSRTDFCVDSLRYIPFSGGEQVQIHAVIKPVSGVNVPLFEANMPYYLLLKGLNEQLIINLGAEREDQNKYNGLQVGSINAPNNNAGNWE
ncbi:MAG: hypothetical protein IJU69_03755 [Bacteroidales bacterium]|nr:hypothetical protein [Bacteroidales bacterium]